MFRNIECLPKDKDKNLKKVVIYKGKKLQTPKIDR